MYVKFRSIRNKLYFLLFITLAVLLAFCFVTNYLYHIALQNYQASLESQIALNNYYSSNRRLYALFSTCVLFPSESTQNAYMTEIDYSLRQLEALSRLNANTDFQIYCGDIRNMFATYQSAANKLIASMDSLTASELAYNIRNVLFINDLIDYSFPSFASHHADSVSTEINKLVVTSRRHSAINFVSVVFCSIFVFLTGYNIINQIVQPILKISEGADAISRNNFDVPDIYVDTNDELATLARAFNSMKKSIGSFIQEQKEHALLQETYLKSIQAQINSHFLFNTLNLISRTAYFEGASQSVQLLETTTDMLRYSLYHSKESVSIFEEIAFTEAYILIQRMRFTDQLSFRTIIDENLKDIQTPSFIIQPLIENAIVHGAYGKNAPCNILTAVLQFDDHILILVEDDGCGVDETFLKTIFDKSPSDNGGIGLGNLRSRLQYFYKEDNLIHVFSQKGEFFRVEIEIKREKYE